MFLLPLVPMEIPSLLRLAEHHSLEKFTLTGKVLDIGGDVKSTYRRLIQGNHSFVTINLDEGAFPDILHDLEKPLPLGDRLFDHAILINVLEHVFEYRQLLREVVRVVKPGGEVVVVVPFLFPVHPSPHDFRRFTAEALLRECELAGMGDIRIAALGTGVFAAGYVFLDRLLPWPLRLLNFHSVRYVVALLDVIWTRVARLTKKKYTPQDYALGYVVQARVK